MANFNNDSVIDLPYTSLPPAPPLPLPPPLILPCEQIYLEEKSFNFDLTDNTTREIPKSTEVINTVSTFNAKDDFYHPAGSNKNLVYNFYNKDPDNDFDVPFVEEMHTDYARKNKDINWDDMLDSELLVSAVANQEEYKKSCVDNIIDNRILNDNVSKINNIAKEDTKINAIGYVVKRKIKKRAEPGAKKVKSDGKVGVKQQKLKGSVSPPVKKNNFRKEKYTKAVKNWLNNVETHYSADMVGVGTTSDDGTNTKGDKVKSDAEKINIDHKASLNKTPIMHIEKIITGKTLKTTKKVVQAQLANKDGVMKFSKPKQNGEDIKKCTADAPDTKSKVNKEKKGKVFVAPIKSQIPVKDLMYEIRTFDEDSIESVRKNLCEIKNKEIIAVLIFSNGFCQLNSHHTDGTCAPDGLLVSHDDLFYYFKSTGQKLKETLKHLLENNKIVCYEARGVLIYLATHLQMEINTIDMYDAKIGASLLDPDNSPENFTDLQKLLSFTAPFTIATECTLQKAAWYMSLLRQCWAKLYGMLVEDSLWNVFVEIEMKLLPIIADMERRGVCIDVAKLNTMEEVLLTRIKLVEQQCYKAAGKNFQINSAMQVRAILYDELQLDTKCNIKIRETVCKGAKSTSESMLRSLASEHPLPRLILEYRRLHKAHATFLTGIAQHVKDGVVRPTWVQTAAATGRIASNNPNLQAIPKAPFSLVMFPDADDDRSQLQFRSVYVARAGCVLLAADFKHVECRVFAHAAHDHALRGALAAGDDLFQVLAAQWLKKPEAAIVSEERERTKRLVYASLYGAGTRKLMEILDVTYQEALQVAASFNRTFPSLKAFGRAVVERCAAAGGRLSTLCGRARRFLHINSDDFALKSHAERQAINFVVQGSAADLCKSAMILTEQQLRCSAPPLDARLLLQIHDELVWEVRTGDLDRAAEIIKQVMEGCGQRCGLDVSLPVALSTGRDWGSMRPYAAGAPG
ncbi:hypothetical protein PYW08_016203 [Mythimna loreyi]|uniref:Uncharacterized protein n=1 Tax=Mythimna loreyi TaxID=667449 RepID=A0ACC2QXD7_9NEOP|nr:hypothetical protein PYW08_016203 [Mythimna loreyi]